MTGEKYQGIYLQMVLNNQERYLEDYRKTVERLSLIHI